MIAMKAEVEPTGRPTKASFTRFTPRMRQASSTSTGSAWWSATKKNSRTGCTPPVLAEPSGGEVSTMQCRPRGRRSLFGSCRAMPQRATRLRFWGWPRLPVRIRTSRAPSSMSTAFRRIALPRASGSPIHWVKMLAPRPRIAWALRRRPMYAAWAWVRSGRLSSVRRFPRSGRKRCRTTCGPGIRGLCRILPFFSVTGACGSPFPWPVERPAFPRQVLEDLRRTEAIPVPGGQLLEHLDREARAQVVEVTEGPAQERREAQAVDRPHVAVPRRAQDALLQAERGLVEEREDQAVLDVARLEGPPGRAPGQQRVDRLVHPLLLPAVGVEAPLVLAPLAPVL